MASGVSTASCRPQFSIFTTRFAPRGHPPAPLLTLSILSLQCYRFSLKSQIWDSNCEAVGGRISNLEIGKICRITHRFDRNNNQPDWKPTAQEKCPATSHPLMSARGTKFTIRSVSHHVLRDRHCALERLHNVCMCHKGLQRVLGLGCLCCPQLLGFSHRLSMH